MSSCHVSFVLIKLTDMSSCHVSFVLIKLTDMSSCHITFVLVELTDMSSCHITFVLVELTDMSSQLNSDCVCVLRVVFTKAGLVPSRPRRCSGTGRVAS